MHPGHMKHRSGFRSLFWLLFWAALIAYVIQNPSEAAGNARALFTGLGNAVESGITFIQQATGGGGGERP